MRRILAGLLLTFPALVSAHAFEQLVPAGSIIQCTVSEPKLSSKTASIGDPVLCQVSHVERYGRSVFPYGSYLVGRFEDYKDPGHFVGKGWMELKFDRMVVQPDTVVPVEVRVVAVPKYPVDKQGRIDGRGHPVRDIVEWSIPVLWPIDLINLPRRGPRPVLGPETRLTLKVLDDFGIPTREEQEYDRGGPTLHTRAQLEQPPMQQPSYPVQQSYAPPQPVQQAYAAPAPQTVIYQYGPQYAAPPPQRVYVQAPPVVYHYPVPVPAMMPYAPYGPPVPYRMY